MSDEIIPDSLAVKTEIEGLRKELKIQAFLTNIAVLLVLLFTLFMAAILLRQTGLMRRQAAELQAALVEYEKSQLPAMEEFRAKMEGFAKTSAEFATIYRKYFTITNSGTGLTPEAAPSRLPPAK